MNAAHMYIFDTNPDIELRFQVPVAWSTKASRATSSRPHHSDTFWEHLYLRCGSLGLETFLHY